MFKYFKLLPGDVAKQKPRLLFSMLGDITAKEEQSAELLSALDWFYGK